jgi:hypothetical protein
MSRVFRDDALFVDDQVIAESLGSIEAERLLEGIKCGALTPDVGWFRFLELVGRFGLRSTACRSFVATLVKRGGAR